MDFAGQYVVVIGTKRSGLAAAKLLRKHGAIVRALDSRDLPPEEREPFDALGIPVFQQSVANLANAERRPDIVVVSPAVPSDLPLLMEARRLGIPVIGEVELSSYFLKGPVVAITGSNGKTTTTALTGHLLKSCNIPCQVGGNIGTAVTSLVETSDEAQWNVLELSSFQLETIYRFRAEIAACLNVTPDHLDRHHTFEAYVNAKGRLFETQRFGHVAVLNYDDPVCRKFSARTKAEVYWFSSSEKAPNGVYLEGGHMVFDGRSVMRIDRIRMRGRHNLENAMAAALMARLAGAHLSELDEAIHSFPGVAHRIEFVRSVRGVEYFNDSKATNVDATLKAVDAFPGYLWLILGGKHKGSPYTPLIEPLKRKAKGVLLIGAEPPYPHAAAPIIEKELGDAVPILRAGTLADAIRYAHKNAEAGDVVLLSPACASFDQFESFEHRGDTFKQIVSELF
jgi:UDP-N-acetylmuramoylalanine--D-glutamate ligase